MRADVAESIDEFPVADWNRLAGQRYPFLRHEFLHAAESSGCVSAETGWRPRHLGLRDTSGRLVAAMPLYEKSHSWGEFVFDWSWAHAYERAGLDYYPKLVSTVPFTPAPSQRLLAESPDDAAALVEAALAESVASRDAAAQINTVGATRQMTVGATQTHDIASTDTWQIGGNQEVSIGGGQTTEIVKVHDIKVGEDSAHSIGKNMGITVGEDMNVEVGKNLVVKAVDSITFTCGKANFQMKKDGTIVMEGKDISITGSGKITAKASGDMTLKGSKINQN